MRARAAWTALFGGIVLIGQFPAPAKTGLLRELPYQLPIPLLSQGKDILVARIGCAEASFPVLFLELVSISDFPKENEPSAVFRCRKYLNDVGLCDRSALAQGVVEAFGEAEHAGTGGDVVLAPARLIQGREMSVFGQGPFCHFDYGIDFHVVGWRQPIVLESISSPQFTPWFDINNRIGRTANICSELSFGRGLSSEHETLGGTPETPRRDSKDARRQAKNDSPNRDYAFGIKPIDRLAPSVRRPFLPIFGAGALTFLFCMFAGIYVYNRGSGLRADPKRKWIGLALEGIALLLFLCGTLSFVFGFPWAALL